MQRFSGFVVVILVLLFVGSDIAHAQFGRGGEWTTVNGDAQRTSWVRTDSKISQASIEKGGFQFLWKLKLDNEPKQLNSLLQPVMVGNIIGYRGFKSLAYVGGSSDNIYSIDYDLGKLYWVRHFNYLSETPQQQAGSRPCPGGMTASSTRPTTVSQGRGLAAGGRGAGGPAAPGAGGRGGAPGQGGGGRGGGGGFGAPSAVYAVSSDGVLHSLNLQNGEDWALPMKFLPPNARTTGLIAIENVIYAATSGGCGGVPNGIWSIDLSTPDKMVNLWPSGGAGIVGAAGPSVGNDGTIYFATGEGAYDPSAHKYSRTLASIDPKTLMLNDWFTPSDAKASTGFTTSPVVLQFKGNDLIVAAANDGRMYLLDSSSLGGADHQTPLHRTPQYASDMAAVAAPGSWAALASWEEINGARWVLAPLNGPLHPEIKFPNASGAVKNGSIVAFKVIEENGKPTLQPAWVSRDMVSPLPPIIVNGVIFALSSGEYATPETGAAADSLTAWQRAERSVPAILYALDAVTGKELWNSGKTITSFAHSGGLSSGGSQVYVGTYDSTFYTFGFWMEH